MMRLCGTRLLGLIAVLLSLAPTVRGQTDRDFTVLRDWDAGDGARTQAVLDTLRLTAGSIHSPKVYADFVFRFEYRPMAADDDAEVLVRTRGYDQGEFHTYAVALNTSVERGRLSALRQVLHDSAFRRREVPATAGTWIPCEIRAEGDRLTVSVDGAIVSTADQVEEPFGTIGFRVTKGAVELRGMQLASLDVSNVVPADLPRADGPGITPPKALRRVQPQYSAAAMRAGAHGVAVLEFVIEADGRPGAVEVKKAPHPDLAVASVACLRQWRFAPAEKNGQPIAVVATMELEFKLKK
jgi:TonB family protein